MCNIFCLTSHDPAKRDDIILRVWRKMSLTQRDGYGAAWFSPEGKIGYYKRRYPCIDKQNINIPKFINLEKKEETNFESSNNIPSDGGFLIIHGRSATSAINLSNTHPMLYKDENKEVALIHNGSIHTSKYNNSSINCTCDSELLLHAYLDGGVDAIERHTHGWYAFMLLRFSLFSLEDKQEPTLRKTLHICKDSRSSLFGGQKKDNTFVFATTCDLIAEAEADFLGEITDHTLLIFSDATNYIIKNFLPIPWTQKDIENIVKRQKFSFSAPPLPSSVTPSFDGGSLERLEIDYSEEEKLEIERLEKEAISDISSYEDNH